MILWAGLTVFTSRSKQHTCSLILNHFEIEIYSNLNVNFVDSDQISENIHLLFITIGFLGCRCLILIGWLMHTYFNSLCLILTTGDIATGNIPIWNDFMRWLYLWNNIFPVTFIFTSLKMDGAVICLSFAVSICNFDIIIIIFWIWVCFVMYQAYYGLFPRKPFPYGVVWWGIWKQFPEEKTILE